MEERRLVASGSPLEPEIGFSRAVRVGSFLAVAGTAPIGPNGAAAHRGDVYAQTRLCLDIIRRAIEEAGLCRSRASSTPIGWLRSKPIASRPIAEEGGYASKSAARLPQPFRGKGRARAILPDQPMSLRRLTTTDMVGRMAPKKTIMST
jgi:hypothetical protein